MRHRLQWLIGLLIASPILIGVSVFLGDGWRHPFSLLQPERAGILVSRLWRAALGTLVGISLSVAGCALQATLRNPLAEPYVLGLSSGAALGAALCILAGGLAMSPLALPAFGFFGALVSMLIVYRLARVGRGTAPHTLILAGVIWGSVCGSALMFIVSQSSVEGLHAIQWWFLGDLQAFDVRLVEGAGALIALAFVGLWSISRRLNVLTLGEEMAGHLGLEAERTKVIALGLAAIMTAAAVSAGGVISFVGLIIPHATRALVGPDHRRLLPAAAMTGAAFLTLADSLGRTFLYPTEIPVGVITALIGGPFFLMILRVKRKEVWIG
jgi:iron complex transport system permease protein